MLSVGTLRDKGLSGNQLKLIAAVAMVIDHVGYLLGKWTAIRLVPADPSYAACHAAVIVLRSVGRISFPIFAFLLVEGFFHTRDWRRYALRMGMVALLAEAPFNLLSSGMFIYPEQQNVMVTLLIGVVMMAGLRELSVRVRGEAGVVIQLLAIAAACGLAWLLRTDYSYFGVMLIAIFYWFRESRGRQCAVGYVWEMLFEELWAYKAGLLAGFLPLLFYSGQRGRRRTGYVFYLFYPVHMLILGAVFYGMIIR